MPNPPISETIRFLVVSGSQADRLKICRLLEQAGALLIHEADDGVEALETLKQEIYKFDFVITDINIPEMDGFGLLKAIKEDNALKHLPVLMVTAEARHEEIVLAARIGAAGYIVKPFSRTTLEEKVAEILARLKQTD